MNLDNDQQEQLVYIGKSGSIEALKQRSLSSESMYDRATESPSRPVNKASLLFCTSLLHQFIYFRLS